MCERPDWRSPDIAEHYAQYDNIDFAQEFLRRNPDYRREYRQTHSRTKKRERNKTGDLKRFAHKWGLVIPCDPSQCSAAAPAIWLPDTLSSCVIAVQAPPGFTEAIRLDIESLGIIVARYDHAHEHYIVIKGKHGHLRLWLHDCDICNHLAIIIPADCNYAIRSSASERFYRLIDGKCRRGGNAAVHPTRYQRIRLIQLLRLLDAEAEKVSRRDMAYDILYPHHEKLRSIEWKASHERRRLYRMIDDAHGLRDDGYRILLQGKTAR